MEKDTLSKAIERLKASRERCEAQSRAAHSKGECATPLECEARDRDHGVEVGKQWAITQAEWDELEDVAALSGETTFAVLSVVLETQGYDPKKLAEDFGCDGYPETSPTDAEVIGFVEGVRFIKDQVDAA
jgi:hypothetical protein